MKKNWSIKKGMATLLGSLLTVGLLVGGGSVLKAQAAEIGGAIAADEKTNMSLGVTAIANPGNSVGSSGFPGSYVYFGTNTYSENTPLKFRVLQNETKLSAEKAQNRLLLDCDSILYNASNADVTASYSSTNSNWVTIQLNGSAFYNKCLSAVQRKAVVQKSYNGNTVFLMDGAMIKTGTYGYVSTVTDEGKVFFNNSALNKGNTAYWLDKDSGLVGKNGEYSSGTSGVESAGVSPALYLNTDKVLFSKNVSGENESPAYQLTLTDDSLKLSTTNDTPSAGFDVDAKGNVTFPLSLTGGDIKSGEYQIKVLVTKTKDGTSPFETSGTTDRTKYKPSSDSSIVYYGSAEYQDGNATFAYRDEWDDACIFLVAVKEGKDNATSTASNLVYLGEVHQLISSIDITFELPLSDDVTYITDANSMPSISSAFTAAKASITGYNGNIITTETTALIKVTGITYDNETYNTNDKIVFNSPYTISFQIQKENNSDKYDFDPNGVKVKISYKTKKSDETTASTVTITTKQEDISGGTAQSDDENNKRTLTVSGFTFTTRKARFINTSAALNIGDEDINYASDYDKVKEYLNNGETYTTKVPIEGGNSAYEYNVPVSWDANAHESYTSNTYGTNNKKEFYVEGTLEPSNQNLEKVEFPDSTSKRVLLTVNMAKQLQVDSPKASTADGFADWIDKDGKIKIGYQAVLKCTTGSPTIYYTLDGSHPDKSNSQQKHGGNNTKTDAIMPKDKTTTTRTLMAYAVRGDDIDSDVLTKTYTFATNTLTAVDAATLEYTYGSEITSGADSTGSDSGSSEGGDAAEITSTKQASVFWGATVTAKAEDKTSEGKIFTRWTVKSGNLEYSLSLQGENAKHTDAEIKFEMPNQELTLTANYESVDEPQITTNPQEQNISDGGSANFSVALTYPAKYQPESFTYQWQKSTDNENKFTDIEGAKESTYSITDAKYSQNGEQYRCIVKYTSVVDNQKKTLTSDAATLTVKQTSGKLEITEDLTSSATVEEGKNITFSIAATPGYSDNTLSYQWYVADNTTDEGTEIDGATEASYTISKATVAEHNDKVYYCKISEKAQDAETVLETKDSTKCSLTVSNKASNNITVTNGTATVDGKNVTSAQEGTTVTITADKKDNKKFTGWSISRADGESIKVDNASAETTTFTMPASAVTITANFEDDYSINITEQPSNVSVPDGQNATFTVAASCYPESAELTYQWQKAEGRSSSFTDMPGETADSLTVKALSSMNGNRYRCVVSFAESTHADVSVTSEPALLSVEAAVYTIKVNGGIASASSNKSGETITITADEAPEGQEFKKWTVVSGSASFADATATETTFTMPNKDVEITAEFQTKLAAPTITKQPENVTVYAGSSTSFTIEATGEEMSYQWQVDKTDGKGFQNISGATNTSYRIYTEDGSMNGYKYKCVVSNRSASVESNTVTLTVNYKITEGANSTWKKSSTTGLTFQGNGAYAKFRMIKVDGKLVGAGNYTKKSDPTIISLVASYLETLSTGEHTLTIVWEDGTAEAIFTVSDSSSTSNSGTSSGSSSSKSSSSSSSSSSTLGSTSSDTTKKSTNSTGTADMPVVNRYKDGTAADAEDTAEETTTENTDGTEAAETDNSNSATTENGSVITSLDGDLDEKPSKLNQYAAAVSIAVIGLSALGGISAFLIRKIRKQDEE